MQWLLIAGLWWKIYKKLHTAVLTFLSKFIIVIVLDIMHILH